VENGYTFASARQDSSKLRTLSGPSALVRFGISKALELRFSTNGYSWQTLRLATERSSVSGPNDVTLGAKFRMLEQTAKRPEVSITGGVSLPARGSAFTTSGHDPNFTLAAYKDLPEKWSVAANANFASITDSSGRIFSSGESLWAARDLGHASIYADVFHTTVGRLQGSEVAMDLGLFRAVGKNAQIDVGVGHTLSGAVPSWFVTMGISVRDPHRLLATGWRQR
jgi:hypothetical protein